MGYLFFIVNNTLAFAIGAIFSDRFFKFRPLHIRVLAWLAGFPVVALLITLSLLCSGMLTVVNITILSTVLLGAALFLKSILGKKDLQSPPSESGHVESKHCYTWMIILAVFFFAAGIFLGLILPGTNFKYDDLTYHASFAAHCLSEQTLNVVPYCYQAYFPLNAETFSLWLMLGFHADGFASLTGVFFMSLIIMSGLSICRTVKCSKYVTALICTLLFSSQVCKSCMETFCSVDVVAPAMALAAIAIAVDYGFSDRSGEKFGRLLFSGLFAGYAVGCKISFAPLCAILFIWWVLADRSKLNLPSRLRWTLLFIVGVFLTGSFWYIRNLILTGNPVFPAELGPFDGPLASENSNRTKLITWILQSPLDFQQWKLILINYASWPPLVFFASLAGYIGSLWVVCFNRRKFNRQFLSIYFLLMVIGVIFIIFHPFMPYSGTDDSSDAPLRTGIRFVILPWAIGIIGYSSLFNFSVKKIRIWYVLGICCAVLLLFIRNLDNSLMNTGFLAIALTLTWFAGQLQSKLGVPRVSMLSVIMFFTALLIGFAPNYKRQQYRTDRNLYYYGETADILKRFESPLGIYNFGIGSFPLIPEGSVITSSGLEGRYYGLFGRNYQYVPKKVSYVPLHIQWKNDLGNMKWWGGKTGGNFDKLVDNLYKSEIEYVFVRRTKKGWPVPNSVLAESQRADKIYDDDHVIIWKLK